MEATATSFSRDLQSYFQRTTRVLRAQVDHQTLSDIQHAVTIYSSSPVDDFIGHRDGYIADLFTILNSKQFTELADMFKFLNTCLKLKTKVQGMDINGPTSEMQTVDNQTLKTEIPKLLDGMFGRIVSMVKEAFVYDDYSHETPLTTIISESRANLSTEDVRELVTALSIK